MYQNYPLALIPPSPAIQGPASSILNSNFVPGIQYEILIGFMGF